MATQSIIVYRNPGEEAMWNVLMSGEMIPIALAAAAGIGALVVLNNLAQKKFGYHTPKWVDALVYTGSAVIAFLVGRYFWI